MRRLGKAARNPSGRRPECQPASSCAAGRQTHSEPGAVVGVKETVTQRHSPAGRITLQSEMAVEVCTLHVCACQCEV